jgi:glycosyltransferase involved in cell wall biosynthesis
MKIAIIEKDEPHKMAGVDVFNQRLKDYLSKRGHEIFSLRFSKKKIQDKNTLGIPYYFIEKQTSALIPSERSVDSIKRYLKKTRPNLIYASPGLATPLDLFLSSVYRGIGVSVVGTWHGDFSTRLGPYQIFSKSVFLAYLSYCKQLDLLHVFSQRMKDFYVQRGVDPKRILVLPNGVDPGTYSPGKSAFAREHGINHGVLFLGRLTSIKNPEVLIKSYLAIDPPSDTKLVMVGAGELEEELREKYQDERIIFTGVVTDEAGKVDIIRSCQVFVLPSRFEGMSLALLEAMSVGLCCVATDVSSTEEILSGCGVVISESKVKDQLPLALKICQQYPEFAAGLGRRARQKVVREYNQEKIFARLTAEFERVVREYPGRAVSGGGLKSQVLGLLGLKKGD